MDTLPNEKMEMKHSPKFSAAHLFLLLLLGVVLYFVFKIIQPYFNTIVLAIILASVSFPINRKIESLVRGKRNLAALISCLLLIVVILLPLALITSALIQQGIQSFNAIQTWLADGHLETLLEKPFFEKGLDLLEEYVPSFDPSHFKLNEDLIKLSSGLGKFLLDQGGFILGNVTSLIAKFFLMIFVFFFMVRDGEQISKGLLHLIPLSTTQETQIIERIKAVAESALLGTFLTALAQGVAGGFAFWISGLPGLFWGTMMAFASLIPVVGTALIWVPAVVYLLISGHVGFGIFMGIWCAVVVGSIDNFLRPMFMKGSAGMSPLLIFFAILGGIQLFGFIGILYGPLIFGLAMVLLYIYELEYEDYLKVQDST
jgi:predicted PurR-regulated permease PerM